MYFPIKTKLVTKFLVALLVISLALSLAGCDENAAPLKEAFMKNMEIKSSRGFSTLSITNNVPSDQLSQEALAVFSLLEKGLTMEFAMESIDTIGMQIALEGDDLLRMMGLWPYQEEPSIELLVNQNRFFIKSSSDPLYLVFDPADAFAMVPGGEAGLSFAYDPGYTKEQVEMVMALMETFMQDFDFSFSQLESLEEVELELPDGTVLTQVYKVKVDFEEAMDLLLHFLKFLAENEAFKNYMVESMQKPMQMLAEQEGIPQEQKMSPEEIEEFAEMAYQEFQKAILKAVKYLENNSPATLQQQFGLDFNAEETYYLDEEGFIRKTVSRYDIKAEHEILESILGTSLLDITIESEEITWDINEAVQVDFPSEDEQISFFALLEDPGLKEELGEGPLGLLVNFLTSAGRAPGGTSFIIDLEKQVYLLNGEAVELEPAPYMEGESLMVPFRALAEAAGGSVTWVAETRQVYYEDDSVELKFNVGSSKALVNGEEVELPVPTLLKGQRAMVPVELLDYLARDVSIRENMAFIIF
ncbi:MAG: copper amine oxidase N-terminal domain-containing protein [Firmicutes bacterium]|nr:copper amine oxidase N-terminal domain-containing protein [Bacillota bacterium]